MKISLGGVRKLFGGEKTFWGCKIFFGGAHPTAPPENPSNDENITLGRGNLTCAIPVTEIGTPSTVYTLGESTLNVIVFRFNLQNDKSFNHHPVFQVYKYQTQFWKLQYQNNFPVLLYLWILPLCYLNKWKHK